MQTSTGETGPGSKCHGGEQSEGEGSGHRRVPAELSPIEPGMSDLPQTFEDSFKYQILIFLAIGRDLTSSVKCFAYC